MIKRKNEFTPELREHMRGGNGTAELTNFITEKELYGKGRMFGTIRLAPGCGIGYHVHEKDSELFYIVKGTAVYTDADEEKTVYEGDVTLTPAGTGHAIRNDSDEDVLLVALIVYA